MISFKNVSYRVDSLQIIGDVSCDALSGEIMAVMGPNGSGKSTLMRIAAGDIKATSGQIELLGKELSKIDAKETAKVRAVLSQHWQTGFPFEVKDVIMMGRYPHFMNMPSEADYDFVSQASSMAGVSHLLNRKFTQLSGGEQQRVQFARVLAQVSCGEARPGILLLDEPTSSLDLKFQIEIMNVLKYLCTKGFTIVSVLHDITLAHRYADHLLFMKKGEKIACGKPDQVLSAGILSEVYEIEPEYFIDANLSVL